MTVLRNGKAQITFSILIKKQRRAKENFVGLFLNHFTSWTVNLRETANNFTLMTVAYTNTHNILVLKATPQQ